MTVCAVCQLSDGLVVSLINADPTDIPQEGCQLIKVKDDYWVSAGWIWTGTKFINPNPDLENPDFPTEEVAG